MEGAEQQKLQIICRLKERQQLLEETLSPDPAAGATFNFGQAVHHQQDPVATKLEADPLSAVLMSVERMEALLLGDDCDFSDLDDCDSECQDGVADEADNGCKGCAGEPDSHGDCPPSPSRGGA